MLGSFVLSREQVLLPLIRKAQWSETTVGPGDPTHWGFLHLTPSETLGLENKWRQPKSKRSALMCHTIIVISFAAWGLVSALCVSRWYWLLHETGQLLVGDQTVDWTTWRSNPGRNKKYLLQNVQTGSGTQVASYSKGTGGTLPWG